MIEIVKLYFSNDPENTCMRCEYYIFKFIMGLITENEPCIGVCGNKNNDIYYVGVHTICEQYESKLSKHV